MSTPLERCEEHPVAGGPEHFMEVRHLVLEGDNRAIGAHLAGLARDRLGCRKEPWTDPARTRAQRAWLEELWPGHAQRAHGAAEALGIDPFDPRLDPTFLYFQWAVPGCSVVFYPPSLTADGHATLARNYDFTTGGATELLRGVKNDSEPPATSRPFVMEIHPDVGFSTLTLCAYELLAGATDGINSQGLSVALLADVETLSGSYAPRRSSGVGISEIQLVRWLLETCRDATEARRALRSAPQFYIDVPCHYMVADASGDSFVWELGFTDEPRLVEAPPGCPSSVTNHLLYEHERAAEHVGESVERRHTLDASVAAAGPVHRRADIEAANRAVAATAPAGQGQYKSASLARTLWHAFYDLAARELDIDFYLGDEGSRIRRSPQMKFTLHQAPTAPAQRGTQSSRTST